MISLVVGGYVAVVLVTILTDSCHGWQGHLMKLRLGDNVGRYDNTQLIRPSSIVGRRQIAILMIKLNTNEETRRPANVIVDDGEGRDTERVEEYKNIATAFLSNFIQKDDASDGDPAGDDDNPLAMIDWNSPKISSSTPLEKLAAALDYELTEKEWFVTGQANPSYFSDEFEFQDPDVKLSGIRKYCEGVNKLFNQDTARAEIISTVVNTTTSDNRPVITCTWRLSGGIDIGPGITIKPYIVYTDFVIDPDTMLIVFQEDRFSIPSWDILLR
jgi:hypothetical protein